MFEIPCSGGVVGVEVGFGFGFFVVVVVVLVLIVEGGWVEDPLGLKTDLGLLGECPSDGVTLRFELAELELEVE